MSLAALAIRITAARALRAALPAAFSIHDSPQEPLDLLDTANPRPLIALYTGNNRGTISGRQLLGGATTVALSIQIFLPSTITLTSAAGVIALDTRGGGAETALDVIWRRVANALLGGADEWAALWQAFVVSVSAIENSSYLIEHAGVRCVAREVTLTCDPLHDPTPGAPPQGAWARLITAMKADAGADGVAALGAWLEAEIAGAPSDGAEQDRLYLGLSAIAARNLRVTLGPALTAAEADLDATWPDAVAQVPDPAP